MEAIEIEALMPYFNELCFHAPRSRERVSHNGASMSIATDISSTFPFRVLHNVESIPDACPTYLWIGNAT